ncbi:GntR family transcriptional regulator [Kutzneria kofuensis]|uniref:DNA-binding GntR family transcriptional regulator n=2 Tax=Kutzneria kofuensis TaxID=103725 RepID=A0A7W9NIJ2_9PSEU|nr:GntR family transcriptional regulator [Kutzneria kofuensis]MBB5893183.1 DNA-binding GntR family transcriptional regulator [Kutzneria kofuensis]
MTLDPTDRRPAYQQIADDLRQFIASDAVGINDKLPSLTELTEKYGRAVMTIRKALDSLQDEGLVVTRHGEGTYVVQKPAAHAEPVTTPRELLDSFRRMSESLAEITDRLAAVESAVFGQSGPGAPRRDQGDD